METRADQTTLEKLLLDRLDKLEENIGGRLHGLEERVERLEGVSTATFPVVAHREPVAESPQRSLPEPVRVMVVEDEPVYLAGLRVALEPFRAQALVVAEATTVQEALDISHDTRPDIVLLDLVLPERAGVAYTSTPEQGLRLIRYFSHEMPSVKVLVLSSVEKPDILVDALANGAHGYLIKREGPKGQILMNAIQGLISGEAILGPTVVSLVRDYFRYIRETSHEVLASEHWDQLDAAAGHREQKVGVEIVRRMQDERRRDDATWKAFMKLILRDK